MKTLILVLVLTILVGCATNKPLHIEPPKPEQQEYANEAQYLYALGYWIKTRRWSNGERVTYPSYTPSNDIHLYLHYPD